MHNDNIDGHPSGDTLPTAALRDLAWLAATPDLIEMAPPIPCAGRPTLKELGLENSLLPWLRQLPIPSLTALTGSRANRMGHYHERLWHTLLDHAPNTRMLAHNVRITRQRITLGELDMLYRTRDNPAPIHLEVAIKFYLGLPEGPGDVRSQSRWIGPGGADSLALKCAHLQRHQLPLSTTLPALATLNHWLAPRDLGASKLTLGEQLTQRLAIPGVLYYPWKTPWHTEMPPPEGATLDHRRGRWCYCRDWPAFVASSAAVPTIAWLEKPHWLAPPLPSVFRPIDKVLPGVIGRVQAWRSPQQVMLYYQNERRYERVFLVPDDWPHQVPLPPPARL